MDEWSTGTLVVNTFRMRPGVASVRFADFSAGLDQPTVLRHSDIVTRFEAFRVGDPTEGSRLGVDIVEIMQVTDWAAWTAVRDGDPSLVPVMTGFDELVDPTSVRSSFVLPIPKGR